MYNALNYTMLHVGVCAHAHLKQ